MLSVAKFFWRIFSHVVMLKSLGYWDLVRKKPTRLAHITQTKRLTQIKSCSLPEQKIALDHLLLHVMPKMRSLRKTEKNRKRRWLLKKACNNFRCNPYKAGKSLWPEVLCTLFLDQANLDQCKASGLIDKSYHLTLDELEGLPPQPQVIKMFKKGCFTYDDFLNLLSSQRNASAPGLNGIPYKVYKKNSGLCKFLFQILKCAFSKGETPLQWQNAKETNPQIKSTIQKLDLRFLTNCSSKYWR